MFQPKRPRQIWSSVLLARASMNGGQAMVDIVATIPMCLVFAPSRAASGIGSCFGTMTACLR
jgi:hypothetical protein